VIAEAFVHRAMQLCRRGGHVALLLRVGFLCTQDRCRSLWSQTGLRYFNPIAERPSFTDDGATDQQEYALFVWSPGNVYPGIILAPIWWRSDAPAEQPALPLFAGGAL
jgi:hypothetical protein